MNFKGTGTKGGKKYTISVDGFKLATILVEDQNSGHQELYRRDCTDGGLTINEKIFEEAILGVCGDCMQMWVAIYEVLYQDKEYGPQQIQKIAEKYFK